MSWDSGLKLALKRRDCSHGVGLDLVGISATPGAARYLNPASSLPSPVRDAESTVTARDGVLGR